MADVNPQRQDHLAKLFGAELLKDVGRSVKLFFPAKFIDLAHDACPTPCSSSSTSATMTSASPRPGRGHGLQQPAQ
jgi:hypothetical protein